MTLCETVYWWEIRTQGTSRGDTSSNHYTNGLLAKAPKNQYIFKEARKTGKNFTEGYIATIEANQGYTDHTQYLM